MRRKIQFSKQREKIREKGNSESLEPMIVLATRANRETRQLERDRQSRKFSISFFLSLSFTTSLTIHVQFRFFHLFPSFLCLPFFFHLSALFLLFHSVLIVAYFSLRFFSYLFTSVSSEISSTDLLIGLILARLTACSLLFPTLQSLACLFVIVVLFSFEFDARLTSITKSLRDSDETL